MKLNDRLLSVASFVDKDACVIDVGCDHAFLPIYLVSNHLVKKVVASDNKEGPLVQARTNIEKMRLSSKIKVQLANGLEKLDSDIDTVIISGMGGLHMIGICKYVDDKMKQIHSLILSPNNEVKKVRKEFSKMGFYIEQETLVKDHGVIYPVLLFKRGRKRYTSEDYLLGPLLRRDQSTLFKEWNQIEIKKRETLYQLLPKKYWMKKFEIKQELKMRRKIS